MSAAPTVAALAESDMDAALPDLARLRIAVFRDWPYLYDGAPEYEARYLATFAAARDAVIIAARAGGAIVGCATGSSLDSHHAEFAAPLQSAGVELATTFYCGESVLLAEWRGRGVGHAFFDLREAHARARGYRRACFCAVVRDNDHRLKPDAYTPLDAFWRQRGYAPLEGAFARFAWTDIGDVAESTKPMQVWMREF